MGEPIQRRRLFQEVLERLYERIRAGEFVPGDQLPSERSLMEEYGVCRPAIREARQSLESDGIVSIQHGERARVLVPTASSLIDQIAGTTRHLLTVDPQNLEHLKDARLFLETGLARLAARRADAAGLEKLERRLTAHREALEQLDAFLDRDMEFHREIAAMSGNPILPALVEAMFDWLGVYYVDLVRVHGAENLTIEEHQRIFEAIRDGDENEAANAMNDHLTRANALYKQLEKKPLSG